MLTRIITIGNSKGVRIPKALLKQGNFGEEIDLSLKDDHICITPLHRIRQGWEAAFAAMAHSGDDTLLDPDIVPNDWSETEWQW